jgi:hypothetical protein
MKGKLWEGRGSSGLDIEAAQKTFATLFMQVE